MINFQSKETSSKESTFLRIISKLFRFTINSQSGEISTVQALDYESQSQYVLQVEAIDSAVDRRVGTSSVTVNVIDVQDEIPIFVQVSISTSVNENANLGTVVATVTVSIGFIYI